MNSNYTHHGHTPALAGGASELRLFTLREAQVTEGILYKRARSKFGTVDHPTSASTNTFIVRIWLEWSERGPCWRGQVKHIQSGEKAAFLTFTKLFTFLRRHAAMPVGENGYIINRRKE